MKTIYLAGPDVFLQDAIAVGKAKQQLCRDFDFIGLFPLDNQFPGRPSGAEIYRANHALMEQADIGLFNLSPFRGPSADAGTVFELGFMVGRGKMVAGYRNSALLYHQRVDSDAVGADPSGHVIEQFGLGDNLMIDCSIGESGGAIAAVAEDHLAAMAAFRQALIALRQRIYGAAIG